MTRQTIPARKGKAAKLRKGELLKVINTHGTQVVDFWAFNTEDLGEPMAMKHTRAYNLRVIPEVGDTLVTNIRRPILTVVEDTCGVHDTLISACDTHRYRLLGVTDYHDSCTDNLHQGMRDLGFTVPETAIAPFNLWMNVPVAQTPKFALKHAPPASKPGDYITLRAEIDCIVAFSACPQDIIPVNGSGQDKFEGKIQDCHFEILTQ